MANLDIIRGRATVLSLTNQTGSTSSPGDIVRLDTSNSDSYVASSASNSTFPIGVVDETVGIGSNGRVVVSGYARKVKTLAATAKGDFLYTSTTSLTAASMAGSNPSPGAFGYVTTSGSGTATAAHIFEAIPTLSATVSAGSNSMSVGATNTIGDSSTNLWAPASHRHLGLHSITSSSSNTLERPTVNFRPGTGIAFGATDTDGSGTFDTLTISATGSSGSGGNTGDSHIFVAPNASFYNVDAGTWTIKQYTDAPNAAGAPFMGSALESLSQNDAISWQFFLAAGTWTANFRVRKSTNTGIITLNLDTVSQGTADTYNASVLQATVSIIGFTISTTDRHTIQLKMATKNASSSGYLLDIFSMQLIRTA